MTKIRDVLSDDKRDWELRVAAVRPPCRLTLRISQVKSSCCWWLFLLSLCSSSWRRCVRCSWPAQQSSTGSRSSCGSWRRRSNCPPRTSVLRWWERPASLWGKRTYIREYTILYREHLIIFCSPVSRHMSSVLGSRFDHAAEAIMPILLNLVSNSAKVMATSGMAAIRLILRVGGSFTDTMSSEPVDYSHQSLVFCSTHTTLVSSPSSPATVSPNLWPSEGELHLLLYFIDVFLFYCVFIVLYLFIFLFSCIY